MHGHESLQMHMAINRSYLCICYYNLLLNANNMYSTLTIRITPSFKFDGLRNYSLISIRLHTYNIWHRPLSTTKTIPHSFGQIYIAVLLGAPMQKIIVDFFSQQKGNQPQWIGSSRTNNRPSLKTHKILPTTSFIKFPRPLINETQPLWLSSYNS